MKIVHKGNGYIDWYASPKVECGLSMSNKNIEANICWRNVNCKNCLKKKHGIKPKKK